MLKLCWKPPVEGDGICWGRDGSRQAGDPNGRVDGLMWYKDLGYHVNGEFSMSVIQANGLLEDHSHLESGPLSSLSSGPHGTFVGVYDGHGGPEISRFVNENLFLNLKSYSGNYGNPEAGYAANPYQPNYGGNPMNPVQASAENYPQYGPRPGSWGAYDMQRAQGQR